jgi:hypothetical protein
MRNQRPERRTFLVPSGSPARAPIRLTVWYPREQDPLDLGPTLTCNQSYANLRYKMARTGGHGSATSGADQSYVTSAT